jgi:glycosyltransferase involved in cell wall biosynthesis
LVASSSVELSVVIPCLDAATTLSRQLDALAAEEPTCAWEVIVVDNGSTDATVAVAQSYASRFDRFVLVTEARRGRHHACNAGWRAAEGSKLAFVDADDVILAGYVTAMAAALDEFDLVAGRLVHELEDSGASDRDSLSAVQTNGLVPGPGFLPYVMGANFGVRLAALESVGGFESDVPFAEDADLSWRLQLAGFSVGFAPDAAVRYTQRANLRSMFRQHRRYGCGYARLYAKYKGAGMGRRTFREALVDWGRVLAAVPSLHRAGVRYRALRRVARNIGRIEGSIRAGVFYP